MRIRPPSMLATDWRARLLHISILPIAIFLLWVCDLLQHLLLVRLLVLVGQDRELVTDGRRINTQLPSKEATITWADMQSLPHQVMSWGWNITYYIGVNMFLSQTWLGGKCILKLTQACQHQEHFATHPGSVEGVDGVDWKHGNICHSNTKETSSKAVGCASWTNT